jgi:hypothetical protein
MVKRGKIHHARQKRTSSKTAITEEKAVGTDISENCSDRKYRYDTVYLRTQEENTHHYSPDLSVDHSDWIRDASVDSKHSELKFAVIVR